MCIHKNVPDSLVAFEPENWIKATNVFFKKCVQAIKENWTKKNLIGTCLKKHKDQRPCHYANMVQVIFILKKYICLKCKAIPVEVLCK